MIIKFLLITVFINAIAANDRLSAGQCLYLNQAIDSGNGCFQFILQNDGNLVLYRSRSHSALWSSGTHNRDCTNRVCLQSDGNLVTYDCNDQATWASGTRYNAGAYLLMQNDGNAVLYSRYSRPLWASNTKSDC